MKQNQQYEYLKVMNCVVRQECKCRGRLIAGETGFVLKWRLMFATVLLHVSPPSPYIQIAYQFVCTEQNFQNNSKVQRSLQNSRSET